ncbi:hypothetical protein HMPREF7215_0596 [Pyramidobacter piscolens W5455]|uniref:Uncharacterized protein n=1 Tax=Pyramidobacter piscolens W5455 TaxID=352165 RepID=A0ABP2HUV6_9BACT|nr:hypothetical protein HMPREF7215_0596 [Pyramidobacter piscolens W5455]
MISKRRNVSMYVVHGLRSGAFLYESVAAGKPNVYFKL